MQVAVVVIGTQHQLVPVVQDELGKVDSLVPVFGLGFMHHAGPRHEFLDGTPFRGGEARGNFLVGEQIEDRLFLRHLGPEIVHDTNRMFPISAQQGMRQIEAQQKFLNFNAAENQIDIEVALAQDIVPIFKLLR